MSADNVSHIEEKGSLRFVLESGFTAKTVFFGHAGNRERLARESGAKHVEMRRDIGFCSLFGDVAKRHVTKVGHIGFLRILVPFRRENALASLSLHGQAEAAHSGEQVYKCKLGLFWLRERNIKELLEVELQRIIVQDGFVSFLFVQDFLRYKGEGLLSAGSTHVLAVMQVLSQSGKAIFPSLFLALGKQA